jgi:multiple sugar transport system permease protein
LRLHEEPPAIGDTLTTFVRMEEGGSLRKEERILRILLPIPAVLFIVAMLAYPVGYTLFMSFHDWSGSPMRSPQWVGIDNYLRMLVSDTRYLNALRVTAIYTGSALVAQTILGVLLAQLFHREFTGTRTIRSLIILPMMATWVATALVWMWMMHPSFGVLNFFLDSLGLPTSLWINNASTVIASILLVDTWQWTPLITIIVLAGLATLPRDPYESAMIDGASALQIFWHITLPLLRPIILAAVLIRGIDLLKTFDQIMAMTQGGPGFASENLNVYIFQTGLFYFRIGYASALVVSFFVIVFAFSVVIIRIRRRAAL